MRDEPKTLVGIRMRKKTKRELKQVMLLILILGGLIGLVWWGNKIVCERYECMSEIPLKSKP